MLDYLKDIISPPVRDHRIFFFHIAKCGGTSIANAIVKSFKPWRAGNCGTVVVLDENAARFAERHSVHGYRLCRRDLLNYTMSLPEIKCISGHFQYSNAAHDAYRDQWSFVTMLREPVSRWLSHYRWDSTLGKINMPLEEFVNTQRAISFGRSFVDEVTEDLEKSSLDIETLGNIALERYRGFSLVGTIEDTPGFARRFEEIFGGRLDIKHLNKTPKNSFAKEICDKAMQRIVEICEPDTRLYNRLIGNK